MRSRSKGNIRIPVPGVCIVGQVGAKAKGYAMTEQQLILLNQVICMCPKCKGTIDRARMCESCRGVDDLIGKEIGKLTDKGGAR